MSTFTLIVLILILVAVIGIGAVAIYRNNAKKFGAIFDKIDETVEKLEAKVEELKEK